MKLITLLNESQIKIPGSKLIVVDIQPAYNSYLSFNKYEFINALLQFKGKILYFYNGPNLGYENEREIKKLINRIKWLWGYWF